MDQEVFQKVHPREYLARFLNKDVRPDGRSLTKARRVNITVSSIATAVGSAMLKMGKTTAVAGVHATLVQPAPGAPDQGILDVAVELLPMASPNYKSGRSSEEAICLTEYLRSLISPHINMSKLCVEAGLLVWQLRLTVYCVDNDGNLEDAILLAGVAAMRNVLLPSVRIIGEEVDEGRDAQMVEVKTENEEGEGEAESIIAVATVERTNSLEIDTYPLPISFILFDGKVLIDPSVAEESVCDSRITFLFRPTGELRGVLKPGGKNVPENLYQSCLTMAKERIPKLQAKLEAT
ncbi:unnamed protein product [Chondrus crispus]|uniref:Ribosomal RNA-processing protein 43 n=1 Tax=Chondrus crispus TaxID=2769 RepID=R7QL29_CHOCR|nr:unnamed protein product [Chondrus crispus]CDF38095.1 unnamed protein product [Chondrus crispus]|eukprot:XP_005717964.1 unnamed protein product [Chondrus crispus]